MKILICLSSIANAKGFHYGVQYRPAGHATVPPGYTVGPAMGHFRFGTIVYEKELEQSKVDAFELIPIVSIEHQAQEVAKQMGRYKSAYAEMHDEDYDEFELTVKNFNRKLKTWATEDLKILAKAVLKEIK